MAAAIEIQLLESTLPSLNLEQLLMVTSNSEICCCVAGRSQVSSRPPGSHKHDRDSMMRKDPDKNKALLRRVLASRWWFSAVRGRSHLGRNHHKHRLGVGGSPSEVGHVVPKHIQRVDVST